MLLLRGPLRLPLYAKPSYIRLRAYQVCLEHDVLSDEDLWALATSLNAKKEPGLLAFLMDTDDARFLRKVQKVSSAKTAKGRAKKSRTEILEDCAASQCVCATADHFYECLKKIMARNGVDGAFQAAVYDAMVHGRQKKKVLFVVGPSDTGKSTLFRALGLLFRVFRMPDRGSYPLSSVKGKEVMFFNDYTFDDRVLSWAYLKNIMEGGPLPVSMPKNMGEDFEWDSTAPCFGTARQKVSLLLPSGMIHADESAQMDNRLLYEL